MYSNSDSITMHVGLGETQQTLIRAQKRVTEQATLEVMPSETSIIGIIVLYLMV